MVTIGSNPIFAPKYLWAKSLQKNRRDSFAFEKLLVITLSSIFSTLRVNAEYDYIYEMSASYL